MVKVQILTSYITEWSDECYEDDLNKSNQSLWVLKLVQVKVFHRCEMLFMYQALRKLWRFTVNNLHTNLYNSAASNIYFVMKF